MNNESFYGNPGSSSSKYTLRFVTLSEAQEETENRTVQNAVVFPPSSGDKNIDSDIEEKDDIVSSDDEAFEPHFIPECIEYQRGGSLAYSHKIHR